MSARIVITTLALAAACAAFSVAAQQRNAQRDAMKACQADIQAHCASVERGEGRIGQCLKANENKVSAECKTQIQALASRAKERRGQRAASSPQSAPN